MAENNTYFVLGFVAQSSMSSDPRFIHFTPGVQLNKTGDALGQQVSSVVSYLTELETTTTVHSSQKCAPTMNLQKSSVSFIQMNAWNTFHTSVCAIKEKTVRHYTNTITALVIT